MRTVLALLLACFALAGCSKNNDPAFNITYETTIDNNAKATICYKKADGRFDTLYQQPGNFKYQFTLSTPPEKGALVLALASAQTLNMTAKIVVNDSVYAAYAGFGDQYGWVHINNL